MVVCNCISSLRYVINQIKTNPNQCSVSFHIECFRSVICNFYLTLTLLNFNKKLLGRNFVKGLKALPRKSPLLKDFGKAH